MSGELLFIRSVFSGKYAVLPIFLGSSNLHRIAVDQPHIQPCGYKF